MSFIPIDQCKLCREDFPDVIIGDPIEIDHPEIEGRKVRIREMIIKPVSIRLFIPADYIIEIIDFGNPDRVMNDGYSPFYNGIDWYSKYEKSIHITNRNAEYVDEIKHEVDKRLGYVGICINETIHINGKGGAEIMLEVERAYDYDGSDNESGDYLWLVDTEWLLHSHYDAIHKKGKRFQLVKDLPKHTPL